MNVQQLVVPLAHSVVRCLSGYSCSAACRCQSSTDGPSSPQTLRFPRSLLPAVGSPSPAATCPTWHCPHPTGTRLWGTSLLWSLQPCACHNHSPSYIPMHRDRVWLWFNKVFNHLLNSSAPSAGSCTLRCRENSLSSQRTPQLMSNLSHAENLPSPRRIWWALPSLQHGSQQHRRSLAGARGCALSSGKLQL